MLRVSPSAGLATFGYVYLADAERRHEDALTVYLDSAGQEITVLPCPDFERFVVDYNIPDGQLHKGFLGQSPSGKFCFSFKSHINKKSKD